MGTKQPLDVPSPNANHQRFAGIALRHGRCAKAGKHYRGGTTGL